MLCAPPANNLSSKMTLLEMPCRVPALEELVDIVVITEYTHLLRCPCAITRTRYSTHYTNNFSLYEFFSNSAKALQLFIIYFPQVCGASFKCTA